VPAEVNKGGSIAVPAKDLFERVKMMPDGPIHVATHDNSTTTLKAAGTARRYTLRGMPGDDFPPLPAPAEGAPTLAMDVEVLQQLIAKTHFSISTDETRAHLNSALFEWDGDIVRMVTTDGHRLSKMEVQVTGRQASATMLIPLKAVQELRRICDEALDETPAKDAAKDVARPQLQITQSGSSAFFQGAGMTFSVKLVDAQFPPYSQVIPQPAGVISARPRAAFSDAFRAVSIAAAAHGGVKRQPGERDDASRRSRRAAEEVHRRGCRQVPPARGYDHGFNAKYFWTSGCARQGRGPRSAVAEAGSCRGQARRASARQFLAVVMRCASEAAARSRHWRSHAARSPPRARSRSETWPRGSTFSVGTTGRARRT
jgi:hypothetical protein